MNANDNWTRSGSPSSAEEDVVVRDPYAILGVPRDASYEVIRRSYREKAKVCHPDLGTEPGREEEFKLLNWAHRVIAAQHRDAGKYSESSTASPAAGGHHYTSTGDTSAVAEILREGNERLRYGAAAEAESMARLALQRAREDTAPYILLSEALAAQKRYAEAVGCILMALQIDKDCAPAREVLTRLQERSNSR